MIGFLVTVRMPVINRLLLCIVFCASVLPWVCAKQSMVQIINTQSYQQVFYCPNGTDCNFICTQAYGACLESMFNCEGNCIVNCTTTLACSYAKINCSQNANCAINCSGHGACTFLDLSLSKNNCKEYPDRNETFLFTSTMALLLTKGFAVAGYQIENTYVLLDGTIQGLSYDLPTDPFELRSFLNRLPGIINEIINETEIADWRGYPPFYFGKIDSLVVAAYIDDQALLLKTLRNSLSSFKEILYPTIVTLNESKPSISIYYNFSNAIDFEIVEALLINFTDEYFGDIFAYPNSSFITIITEQLNENTIFMELILPDYHCAPPAPFYGTYCWEDKWYSEGDKIISADDFIGSSSGAYHHGSLNVTEAVTVMNSTLTVTEGILVNSTIGTFQVSNSSITTNSLMIVSSTVEISGSGNNISANTVVLTQVNLRIVLTPEQERALVQDGYLEINAINSGSISGGFSNITIVTNQSNYACDLSVSQQIQESRIVAILEVPSCNPVPITQQFLAVIIAIPVVAVVLIISVFVIHLKNQQLINSIRNGIHSDV